MPPWQRRSPRIRPGQVVHLKGVLVDAVAPSRALYQIVAAIVRLQLRDHVGRRHRTRMTALPAAARTTARGIAPADVGDDAGTYLSDMAHRPAALPARRRHRASSTLPAIVRYPTPRHSFPTPIAMGWPKRGSRRTRTNARADGQYTFAITRADDGLLVGAIALRPVASEHENVGYWIGREYWGRGYATAATRAMVALAFSCLDCQTDHRIVPGAKPGIGTRDGEMRSGACSPGDARSPRMPEAFCVRGITRDAWEQFTYEP